MTHRPPEPSYRHFDLEHFAKVTDVDAEIQAAVIDIYIESGLRVLTAIEQALLPENAATASAVLAAATHKCRGGIGVFGAAAIGKMLEKMEGAALAGDFAAVRTDLVLLRPWLQDLSAELARFRHGLKVA